MSVSIRSARLVRNNAVLRPSLIARPRFTGALGATSAANIRINGRLPSHIQALAILVPHRGYATEQSTSTSSSSSFPPPGFNAEQAKKPIIPEVSQPVKADQQIVPKSDLPVTPKNNVQSKDRLSDVGEVKEAIEEKKEQKKLTLGQKIKKEVQHYWDGTKLLATEVKISSRLALKMAGGYELSRREHRQLQRTVKDLGRLVPFSMFVIIPFAELLLPVALKLFPNMLPSTYEGQKAREKKALSLSSTRKEVSGFLKDTLRESGLPVTAATVKNEEFAEFFKKIRTTGEAPSTEDVIKVCKVFKDDLTLDNLSRPQLVAICKYMNLNSFGTDAMLRYNIRHRMRQIKRDDRAIFYEGVESLSVPELQMACASRGIRTHGVSPARLREDMSTWLDLRLKQGVPSTLLVLSNAYVYAQGGKETEMSSQIDALQSVLSSIPEELFHEIELEVHNAEGAATNKQRLEVIKEQEELIEEENEQNSENEEKGVAAPKDHEDIDDKDDARFEAKYHGQSGEAAEAVAEAAKVEQAEPKDSSVLTKAEKKETTSA
ncbi:LETM1-like protein-domain-containing protein [Aspergillus coremiiformis]|uniref:LETM1-like protein-domain-containing protein n=1 Tax=Aspergillus coremiiformis TaxID=138285 RepID=A0A5N6Z371_9EURO|nr:LETM1-like protein-domain-containing protein [Aspergillus coremiiformis]